MVNSSYAERFGRIIAVAGLDEVLRLRGQIEQVKNQLAISQRKHKGATKVAEQMARQIQDLWKNLNQLREKYYAMETRATEAESKLVVAHRNLRECGADLTNAQAQVARLEQRVVVLSSQTDALNRFEFAEKNALLVYESRTVSNFLRWLDGERDDERWGISSTNHKAWLRLKVGKWRDDNPIQDEVTKYKVVDASEYESQLERMTDAELDAVVLGEQLRKVREIVAEED